MLTRILQEMRVDPELLAELSIEQKQILFSRMREEQIRRWRERELQQAKEDPILETPKKNRKGRNVTFRPGDDGNEWVWVMGDHANDTPIQLPFVDETSGRKELDSEEGVTNGHGEVLDDDDSPQHSSPPVRRRSPSTQELQDSISDFQDNEQREKQVNINDTKSATQAVSNQSGTKQGQRELGTDTVDAGAMSSTRVRALARSMDAAGIQSSDRPTASSSRPTKSPTAAKGSEILLSNNTSRSTPSPVKLSPQDSPSTARKAVTLPKVSTDSGFASEINTPGSSASNSPNSNSVLPSGRNTPQQGVTTPPRDQLTASPNTRSSPLANGPATVSDVPGISRIRGDLEKGSVRIGPNVKSAAAAWNVVNGLPTAPAPARPSQTAQRFKPRLITSVSEQENENEHEQAQEVEKIQRRSLNFAAPTASDSTPEPASIDTSPVPSSTPTPVPVPIPIPVPVLTTTRTSSPAKTVLAPVAAATATATLTPPRTAAPTAVSTPTPASAAALTPPRTPVPAAALTPTRTIAAPVLTPSPTSAPSVTTPSRVTPAPVLTVTTVSASATTPNRIPAGTPVLTPTLASSSASNENDTVTASTVSSGTLTSNSALNLVPPVSNATAPRTPTQNTAATTNPSASNENGKDPSSKEIERIIKSIVSSPVRTVNRLPKASKPADRNAIINWFQREELPRRIVFDKDTNSLAPWFHGIVSREKAEELLRDTLPGSFLVRVSDRLWGYAITYKADRERYKHFLIIIAELVNQFEDGVLEGYQFFGPNQKIHNSITELVSYHRNTPITPNGNEILLIPCKQTETTPDYAELFRNWKSSSGVIDCFTEVF